MSIHVGDRYRTTVEVDAICALTWRRSKGSSTPFAVVIPADEELICDANEGRHVVSIRCHPVRYRAFLSRYVPIRIRLRFWKFREYALWVPVNELLSLCELVKTVQADN